MITLKICITVIFFLGPIAKIGKENEMWKRVWRFKNL